MSNIRVVAQDVQLWEIDPKKLTTDCYTVIRKDGIVDVVRAGKMVYVFDHYHDLGIRLQKIEHSWGRRNPKFQDPEW
jgi:hypothetical protein